MGGAGPAPLSPLSASPIRNPHCETTLRRYLTETDDAEYNADATALGVTPNAVKVAVHRLRERFGHALREEVAGLQDAAGDVDGELAHLLAALEA